MATEAFVSFNFPAQVDLLASAPSLTAGGASASSYAVSAQGTGSFTGLSYSVPTHAKGTLKAKIQVKALTSQDIADLNTLAEGMLNATAKSEYQSYQKTHQSHDTGIWSWFSGGTHSTFDSTASSMQSKGLTTAQIDKLMDAFLAAAQKMNHVELDFTIDNTANDYSVDGDLQLYTIAGQVTTSKGTAQFRMLANQGTAGNGAASASGKVIPLS